MVGEQPRKSQDIMPPVVVSTVPGADATNVRVATTVKVTFSEAMNEASAEGAFFLDGVAKNTGTCSDTIFYASDALWIGAHGGPIAGWDMNGWLDEIRIVKGVAKWTSNFTPPTAEYPFDIVDMGAYEHTRSISVTPSWFNKTLSVGNSTTDTLTITNNGDSSVNYTIELTGDDL